MTKMICGSTFPIEFLRYLQKMGLPEHVNSFKLTCAGAAEFVEIECTFSAYENGAPAHDGEKFVTEMKKYRLIEVTE